MGKNREKNRGPDGHVCEDSVLFPLIEEAYRVFKRPIPDEDGVCDCCMDPEIKQNFFRYGQREMPLHYLIDWYSAAALTNMPQNIWSYLLPRVFDALAAGEEVSSIGNEVVLKRYPTGNKALWTKQEWEIIDRFQKQFLAELAPGKAAYLDDYLCMFALGGWSTDALFQQVFAWPTPKLAAFLWNDWCDCAYASIWVTAFWPDQSVPMSYYSSRELYDRMVEFGMDDSTEKTIADKALMVADVIYTTPKDW